MKMKKNEKKNEKKMKKEVIGFLRGYLLFEICKHMEFHMDAKKK